METKKACGLRDFGELSEREKCETQKKKVE